MESRVTCKSLQKQIGELQNRIRELEWDDRSELRERRVVYVQKDRDIRNFSGYNVSVDEWIEDVKCITSTCRMSISEEADFIYSHLEGAAKDEIRYRQSSVRQNAGAILDILQDAFGVKDNVTTLQKNFLERIQKPDESLRSYSYALMGLMRKVTKKDPSWLVNEERTLCDQFSQNVRDILLRKHLKQIVRLNPDIPFLELRQEAILWSEEEEYADTEKHYPSTETMCAKSNIDKRPVSSTGNEQMSQLLDVVKKQSQQIESLQKAVNRKSDQASPRREGYEPNYYGSPLCFGCHKPGHKIADCPEKKKQEN